MDGSVATIGFFDGVHRGHQFVIGCVVDEARRRGLEAVVVTFDRHPRAVLAEMNGGASTTCEKAVNTNGQTDKKNGQAVKTNVPGCLTTRALTQQLILQAGADRCEVLHFDRQLALLSARDFMQQVLQRQLGVSVLMMGYGPRNGHRSGAIARVSTGRRHTLNSCPVLVDHPKGSRRRQHHTGKCLPGTSLHHRRHCGARLRGRQATGISHGEPRA